MAVIKSAWYRPLRRHCQGEAHTFLLVTRGGEVVRQGRGLGFWFDPVGTAVSEVPINDQSAPMMFKARTVDFQDASVSGEVWFTVTDPALVAQRFDFSLNTATGAYNADPLTVIQGALVSSAQEAVWSFVSTRTLEDLLAASLDGLSEAVTTALTGLDMGLQVSRAVVTGVRPEPKVEQSLQAKTRERLQMEADAAGFERRARATEQERAIAEAELANQLELAKRKAALIEQQDANARAEAESRVAVERIAAIAAAEQADIRANQALAQTERTNAIHHASTEQRAAIDNAALAERLRIYEGHPGAARSMALASVPDALTNMRVLTVGEGGLQSVLERVADPDAAK